jgi:hypothetical protein
MSGAAILAIIAGIAIAAVSIWLVRRWSSRFKPIITEFIEAGVAKNVEAAYACCSHYSPTKEEIAELIGSNYDLFEGYECLAVRGAQSQSGGDITEAYVSGAIIYTGGKKLGFKCSLMKENNVWKIAGIQIGSTKKGIVRRISVTSVEGPMGWGGP